MQKILLLASLLSITLITQAAELTYRTECIGSYTLQLPDNLEVALYPTSQYLKPKSHYPIYFADGKWAYLSRFNYNNNNLSITTKWDDNELINVKEQLDNFIQSFKIKSPNDLMELPRSKNSLGYYTKDRSSVTFIEDNKIHKFYTNSYYQGDEKDKGFEFYKKNAEAIIAGF
ncbi:MAG: hypothetical protein J6562_05510, partial [Candidatus Schmidhempelia sp.]|nr:hypothetical protein [Candidatus Schmidhempelia sp.]